MSNERTVPVDEHTAARRVTVIGVGAMGMPMARRLVDQGFDVAAVDPNATARTQAGSFGMRSYESIAECPESDVVLVLVATAAQLIDVVKAGITNRAPQKELWSLFSTVGKHAAQEAAQMLSDAGSRLVDTPMTGGVPGAQSGKLTFFTSGDHAALQELVDVLGVLGTTTHVGDNVGDGQSMKLVNQLCCSVHLAVAAEAIAMAVRLGLDPATTVDVITSGAGASWFLNERGPRMADLQSIPEVSTRLAILAKDNGLVEEAADVGGAHVPLLKAAKQQYLRAAEMGLLEADDSQLIKTYL